MKNVIIFALCLGFCGCGIFHKTRTETRTETLINVDTIIKVVRDTFKLINTVYLHDTAYLENSIAEARSYYDVRKQKIVLELKGKPFEVPITIYKRTIENKKEVVITRKSGLTKPILIGLMILVIIAGCYLLYKKFII